MLHLGYQLSGDAALGREYHRLCVEERLSERMSETLRNHFRAGHTYDGGTFFRQQENPMALKSMAVDCLWNTDSSRQEAWAEALRSFWHGDALVSLDRTNGLNYFVVRYDRASDSVSLTPPGVLSELENTLGMSSLTWGGQRQSAGSAQTAHVAVVVASRLYDSEAAAVAIDILGKLKLASFRGWKVPDARHLPPGDEWKNGVLRTGYIAYWLWAYWLGRMRNLW